MVSFVAKIVSQVEVVALVGKSHVVEPEVHTLDAYDVLETKGFRHCTYSILCLHLFIV